MIIAVGRDRIAATIQADLAGILEDLRKRNPVFELAHNVSSRFYRHSREGSSSSQTEVCDITGCDCPYVSNTTYSNRLRKAATKFGHVSTVHVTVPPKTEEGYDTSFV